MDESTDMVTISAQKLHALEMAAAKLKEIEDNKKCQLNKLKEYEKQHPEIVAKRALRAYHKNKDVINEKRRAAYKAKKEAETARETGQTGPEISPGSRFE
jgi:hypothetical protein